MAFVCDDVREFARRAVSFHGDFGSDAVDGAGGLPSSIKGGEAVAGVAGDQQLAALLAALAVLFFVIFSWFFKKSRMGVAMRAVADNQQVAQAMGINVERYFAIAWAMTGIVSALGGIIWGNMLGVDVQIAVVGLKVFPVVILGGLDSIGGALLGGIIIGVVESLAEIGRAHV